MKHVFRTLACAAATAVFAFTSFAGSAAAASPLQQQLEAAKLIETSQAKEVHEHFQALQEQLSNPQPKAAAAAAETANVKGTVKKGTSTVNHAIVFLYNKAESEDGGFYEATVENGRFSLNLPDGDYQIEGYYDEDRQEFISVPYSFTVKDGKSDPSVIRLKVPADNTLGVMKKAGTRLDGGYVVFVKEGSEKEGYMASVKQGTFNLYLPDGKYKLEGYYNDEKGQAIYYDFSFKVKNGKSPLVAINVPADNVKGTITKGGESPLSGSLDIVMQKDDMYKYYNVQVTDGKFGTYLPDGTYTIEGFYNYTKGGYTTLSQELTVKNGKARAIKIVLPADNVKGAVLIGTEKVMNGDIGVRSLQTGNMYNSNIINGEFSLYLPDGEYETLAFYHEEAGRVIYYPYTFTVANGAPVGGYVNVQLPAQPITGTVFKAGDLVMDGMIQVVDNNTKREYMGEIENGELNIYLPDGSYTAVMYYDSTHESQGALDYAFTVTNGQSAPAPLEIQIPADNVTGTVTKGGVAPEYGFLIIQKDGTENRYFVDIQNGAFHTYLTDGSYHIVSYWDPSLEEELVLDYALTVTNGVTSPITLQLP